MVVFKTGQSLMFRSSWAEMNERELVSVTFQGTRAGGKIERLFGIDGLDDTSVDQCRLFTEEQGSQVDLTVKTEKDPSMGRLGCAANFINALRGKEEPLNTPEESLILMEIVDAVYESASGGKPVRFA
jgi:predicted dehydrogenase